MARSPIEYMIDQATGFGFEPGSIAVKDIVVRCQKCGNEKKDWRDRRDPKGATRIETSCCPKCGVEDSYTEYLFDVNGNLTREILFGNGG